jgi:hypothetical protein
VQLTRRSGRKLAASARLLRGARPLRRELRLRERGAVRLTAIVADDNPAAMAFWRAAGYEQQAHRARFIRHIGLALGEDHTEDSPAQADVNDGR